MCLYTNGCVLFSVPHCVTKHALDYLVAAVILKQFQQPLVYVSEVLFCYSAESYKDNQGDL